MKSYAQVRNHPIHPALIPFPFAFLLGALLFDLAGWCTNRLEWTFTGSHLLSLGLLAGLVAALPGVLDFWKRVPPRSSGRTRAISHGLANVAALLFFAAGWWVRRRVGVNGVTVALELIGGVALVYAGWLGGILVSRNLISVDHRHANAGKWRESRFSVPRGQPLVVARLDELQDDQMKLLVVNGHRIALARRKGVYYAFQDSCTHRGGSLADGACIDGTVQCLWHGSQFAIDSGEVRCGPAKKKLDVYAVRTEHEEVVLLSPP
jgi:nitrite reductase/ring-hydroxylating ferredoxin subunit/uncharacterized membrane protein